MKSFRGKLVPLTEEYIRGIRKPGVYSDGPGSYGLLLEVTERSDGRLSKRFRQRMPRDGTRIGVTVGVYPVVSLREARHTALCNYMLPLDKLCRQLRGSAGRPAFNGHSERLIKESLQAVRELLAGEGDIARGIFVEGSHDAVELLQSVDPESVLVKLRKTEPDIVSDLAVYKIGAEWADRIDVVERREVGSGERIFEGFSRDFFDAGDLYAVSRFRMSPLALVSCLERYSSYQALMLKMVDLGMRLVFVVDQKGTIAPGSRLLMKGDCDKSTLYVLGEDGEPEDLQPVRLCRDAEYAMGQRESRSVWTLESDHGGALLLKFESGYTPGGGSSGIAPLCLV